VVISFSLCYVKKANAKKEIEEGETIETNAYNIPTLLQISVLVFVNDVISKPKKITHNGMATIPSFHTVMTEE
jgi:hypothetical protein